LRYAGTVEDDVYAGASPIARHLLGGRSFSSVVAHRGLDVGAQTREAVWRSHATGMVTTDRRTFARSRLQRASTEIG
jgi:hypothetical protein